MHQESSEPEVFADWTQVIIERVGLDFRVDRVERSIRREYSDRQPSCNGVEGSRSRPGQDSAAYLAITEEAVCGNSQGSGTALYPPHQARVASRHRG